MAAIKARGQVRAYKSSTATNLRSKTSRAGAASVQCFKSQVCLSGLESAPLAGAGMWTCRQRAIRAKASIETVVIRAAHFKPL